MNWKRQMAGPEWPNCSSCRGYKQPGGSLLRITPTQEDFTCHLLATVWHLSMALPISNPSGVLQQVEKARVRYPSTGLSVCVEQAHLLAHQVHTEAHSIVRLTEASHKTMTCC